ncbi:hypothetical protein B0H13DRAFT_2370913 [Mycena leptocephala]|nr:hypothetical protein B0H13DRAFT_2370913 [Mycena leptocephala]
MAPKQQAAKQKKTGGQGSRKAVPKTRAAKPLLAPPTPTISRGKPERLVSLFAEVSICECPPKTVANILREALPHFQEFLRHDPMVYGEHISFLYSVAKATKFAVDIHSKYIKEPEFADLLNIFTPDMRKLRPATTAFVLPRIRLPEAESAFVLSDDEMDEAPSVADVDDVSVADRDDEEEDEPPAPKKLRREVAALQSSPPPQPVASSSKSRITPSPSKTQPVASSSKVALSKMPVPYVAVPSSEHKRKREPAISAYQPQPLPPPIPTPAAAPIQETPHTLRVDMLHEMLAILPANIEELRPMMNLGPEVLSRALLRAIELRRDCDFVFAQLARLTNRLELALDEVVLRFSNINDILPQDYVRFIFENPGDVQLLEAPREQSDVGYPREAYPWRSYNHQQYYVPEDPPLMTNAPSYTDIPAISGHRSSIFAGQPYVAPSTAEDRPGEPHPPLAPVPAASSQPHASPETYAVNPSSLVPSNAPPTAPTNASAAGSVSTSASAGYHSISSARPFGTPGTLLHYPSEFSPGLPRGNHPLRQAASAADPPSSPGQGGSSGQSGSGAV